MKKNSFMQGAFIATMGIVISKILGIIYVIPFCAIIGERGGALYSYAYNIYMIFLGLSSVGIPLAMSKLISEYNSLGYYDHEAEAFKIGKRIITILCAIIFVVLILFAPNIAYLIIGDVKGGNTIADVSFVIRVVALAILVVPMLSVTRGYLQGKKFISPTSVSLVVEQFVRIIVILLGSFLALKVFNIGLTNAIAIAIGGAFVGALVAYLYLKNILKKHKNIIDIEHSENLENKNIDKKEILKKLLLYASPFILVDIGKNLYNSIDIVVMIKVMVHNMHYSVASSETILAIIATWGNKLTTIVIAISTGILISLIPNLTSSYVKKDYKDVNIKINQTLQMLLYVTIPTTVGLSLLSQPVWTVFYGNSFWGPKVFSYFIFTALFLTFFTTILTMLQVFNKNKMVAITLVLAFVTKLALNKPLMYSFYKMGLYPFYGAITATIFGYLIAIIVALIYLKKTFKISYESTINKAINIILATIIMTVVIMLLKMLIPVDTSSRIMALILTVLYSTIGGIIFIFITYKNKTIQSIFGDKIANKILVKLKIKKNA